MELEQIKEQSDERFTVRQYKGVAFYFYGPETEADEDTEWSGYEQETGRALMVMVGDDRKHRIDPKDVTLIPAESYCRDCGQIGCQSNVYA